MIIFDLDTPRQIEKMITDNIPRVNVKAVVTDGDKFIYIDVYSKKQLRAIFSSFKPEKQSHVWEHKGKKYEFNHDVRVDLNNNISVAADVYNKLMFRYKCSYYTLIIRMPVEFAKDFVHVSYRDIVQCEYFLFPDLTAQELIKKKVKSVTFNEGEIYRCKSGIETMLDVKIAKKMINKIINS
jgi:hypothetical protein